MQHPRQRRLLFLPFPSQGTGVPGQQQVGNQGSSAPQHCTATPTPQPRLHPGRVSPPSGTALGNCRSTGHATPTGTKRQQKALLQSMKKHQKLLCPRPGTRFKAAVKWFSSSLCSHLPLDARGWHFPASGAAPAVLAQEGWHRPLGSGSPGSFVLLPQTDLS